MKVDRRWLPHARNLCIAHMAANLGVSFQTAKKSYYRGDDGLGEYWFVLAERVAREVANGIDRQIQEASKPVGPVQ